MGDLTTHIDNPVGENISPQFDIIHNPFDYPSLAFSKLVKTPVVTTIHGFSSPDIYRVYEKYNDNTDQAVNMVERLAIRISRPPYPPGRSWLEISIISPSGVA